MGKYAFPPLPTRPRLVLALYPALFIIRSKINSVFLQTIFKQYDADKSGTFDAFELRRALRSSGYRLSTDVFKGMNAKG